MLVWLASFPRSGNTYMRMCLHWYTKEFIPTYSIPGDKMFVREGVDKDIGHMPLPAMSLEELEKSSELKRSA